MKIAVHVLIGLACLQSCGQSQEQLVPPKSLEEVYERADKADNIRCFILYKDGEILREKYYTSYADDSLDHMRSGTKSVMATLIAIAIDQGIIKSIDDPLSNYLKHVPKDKEAITIRHVIGMTSGLQWDEGSGYNDNNRMVNSGNPIQHMLKLKVASAPGKQWEYSSGDIHILSAILSEVTGMRAEEFAVTHLFEPLGIRRYKWQVLDDGFNHGGSRLQLKPRDMLKFGILFANGGVYEGNQIVSSEMHDLLTGIHHEFERYPVAAAGYGYGWWTAEVRGSKLFMAAGYGGQMIVISPEENMVMVITSNWRLSSAKAGEQEVVAQNIGKDAFLWFEQNR